MTKNIKNFFLTISVLSCFGIINSNSSFDFVDDVAVIIIGGTGDLAKKYLWQGLFKVYQSKMFNVRFQFYGSGRRNVSVGGRILDDILNDDLKCTDGLTCQSKEVFISKTHYFQLKLDVHFKQLCDNINKDFRLHKSELDFDKKSFQLRLFYLAIPPFDYESVLENIGKYCRPKDLGILFRVALEKPFGNDASSAANLNNILKKYFSIDEICLIDHYLWKAGVKQIAHFRSENKNLDMLWRASSIEKIEIVMKEKDDVKGRINYFKNYGIIADVMQNHLMEIFFLITNDMPKDNFVKTTMKEKLLNIITPINMEEILGAQYEEYLDNVKNENHSLDKNCSSPTFAVVIMHLNNTKWHDVPFYMVSGKAMDENAVYVRVVFKNVLSQQKCSEDNSILCSKEDILFIIKHPLFTQPSVLVHKNILRFTDSCLSNEIAIKTNQIPFEEYVVCMTAKESNPYEEILSLILSDRYLPLINMNYVLKLWKLWDPIINYFQDLKLYLYKRHSINDLQYVHVNKKAYFICT